MLKSKKTISWPRLDAIQDQATKVFGEDVGKLLGVMFRDVYDDLQGLEAQKVTALPTAGEDYRGKFRVLDGGAGVADVLKLCIKEAAGTYAWKTVVLS